MKHKISSGLVILVLSVLLLISISGLSCAADVLTFNGLSTDVIKSGQSTTLTYNVNAKLGSLVTVAVWDQTHDFPIYALTVADPEGKGVHTQTWDGQIWNNYIPWTTKVPVQTGQYEFRITAVSLSGTTVVNGIYVNVDNSPPATTANPSGTPGDNGWYKQTDLTMALSATDSGSAGVREISYRVNGGSWTTVPGSSTSFSLPEGENTLDYYATDNVGNSEGIHTYTYKLDRTAPGSDASLDGTMGDNGWYTSDVEVGISATDDRTGVAEVCYQIDGGEWQHVSSDSASFTVSDDGLHTVNYYAVDNAGTTEGSNLVTFKIDKSLPQVTATLTGATAANGWFYTDVQMTLGASDSSSGVSSVWYSLDGLQWNVYTGPVTIKLGPQENVYIGAIDAAGNVKNATQFVYFPPGSYSQFGMVGTPTPVPTSSSPTPVPTTSPGPSVTPSSTPVPESSPTPTPVPAATEQTQPDYSLYLLLLALLLGAVIAVYYVFFRAK